MPIGTDGLTPFTDTTNGSSLAAENAAIHPDQAMPLPSPHDDGQPQNGDSGPTLTQQFKDFNQYIRDNFNELDKNHDLKLDNKELKGLTSSVPAGELNSAVTALDADGDGSLSFHETAPANQSTTSRSHPPSGIEVYLKEIAVASGAGTGLTIDGTMKMVSRYRYSNALLSQQQDKSAAQQIIARNTRLLGDISDCDKNPGLAMDRLNTNGEVLTRAGSDGHAMYMLIEDTGQGQYRMSLYNSGDGVPKYHEKIGDKYASNKTWVVDKNNLREKDLKTLMEGTWLQRNALKTKTTDFVYAWPKSIGAHEVPIDKSRAATQTPQKSGDCTLEGINAFLRDATLQGVIKSDEYKNLTTEEQQAIAKELYRTQFGGYLNQVITDSAGLQDIGPKYQHLLQLVEIRADRIAAGDSKNLYGNQVGTSDGVIQKFKKMAKTYEIVENEAIKKTKNNPLKSKNHVSVSVDNIKYNVDLNNNTIKFKDSGGVNNTYSYDHKTSSIEHKLEYENGRIKNDRYTRGTVQDIPNNKNLESLKTYLPPGFENATFYFSKDKTSDFKGQAINQEGKVFSFRKLSGDWTFSYPPAVAQSMIDSQMQSQDRVAFSSDQEKASYQFDPKGGPVWVTTDEDGMRYTQFNPSSDNINYTRLTDEHGAASWDVSKTDDNFNESKAQLNALPTLTASRSSLQQQLAADQMALSESDKKLFQFANEGSPVSETQSGNTTTYEQDLAGNNKLTLTRSINANGEAVWSATKTEGGSQPNKIHTVALYGKDGRLEETTTTTAGGTKTVTDNRLPSVAANQIPDLAFTHTERTTSFNQDGSKQVHEETWRGASREQALAPQSSYHATKDATLTESTDANGVNHTTEKGTFKIISDGKVHEGETHIDTAHRHSGDQLVSMTQKVKGPDGIQVSSELKEGQAPQYYVEKNGQNVPINQTKPTPAEQRAIDDLRLTTLAVVSDKVSTLGNSAVARLLDLPPEVLQHSAKLDAAVDSRLQKNAAEAIGSHQASMALGGASGSLAIYEGITGVIGLVNGIKEGNAYVIGQSSVGMGAAAAGILHMGIGLASAAIKPAAAGGAASAAAGAAAGSAAATKLSRLSTVAGATAAALGAVAMGMEVPNLVNAIRHGDVKSIVSSSVNIGGGAASIAGGLAVGAAFGGPAGAAVGLVIGLGTVIFNEVWGKLFNQGTPLTGPDPLATTDTQTRTQLLSHVQTLYKDWDQLDDDPNADRFADWAKPDSGKSDAVRAAAQFFVDHPEFVNWLDAAGTGDLRERDAAYHGNISKADLARYQMHIAVPQEVFNTLPPPSQEARLWSSGVIAQDFDLVNAFGKDGSRQASGDADIGLPELLNISSGLYDDQMRAQLEKKYPGSGSEHEGWIDWKLGNLKKACAYVGLNPSEATYIDTVRTGKEDNQLAPADFEKIVADNRSQIDRLLKDHPNGMPSFNDLAEQNQALGANNPALWRTDRWSQRNADAPDSVWNVLLDNKDKIPSLDWKSLSAAREKALQDKNYSLYYATDYVMTFGADLFADRGEGFDLKLDWSDITQIKADDEANEKETQRLQSLSEQTEITQDNLERLTEQQLLTPEETRFIQGRIGAERIEGNQAVQWIQALAVAKTIDVAGDADAPAANAGDGWVGVENLEALKKNYPQVYRNLSPAQQQTLDALIGMPERERAQDGRYGGARGWTVDDIANALIDSAQEDKA